LSEIWVDAKWGPKIVDDPSAECAANFGHIFSVGRLNSCDRVHPAFTLGLGRVFLGASDCSRAHGRAHSYFVAREMRLRIAGSVQATRRRPLTPGPVNDQPSLRGDGAPTPNPSIGLFSSLVQGSRPDRVAAQNCKRDFGAARMARFSMPTPEGSPASIHSGHQVVQTLRNKISVNYPRARSGDLARALCVREMVRVVIRVRSARCFAHLLIAPICTRKGWPVSL
jgi:hypothetical protein